jgi:hypothetical protein
MPLNPASLSSALGDLFAKPPSDRASCAQAWADAVGSYAASVVPPSTTVSAAASTLSGALASAFGSPAAAAPMESAFTTFATTVAGGMTAAGFTGVPPAGPVGFSSLLGTIQASAGTAASAWASAIDTWMKTGVAVLIAPPNTPQQWA